MGLSKTNMLSVFIIGVLIGVVVIPIMASDEPVLRETIDVDIDVDKPWDDACNVEIKKEVIYNATTGDHMMILTVTDDDKEPYTHTETITISNNIIPLYEVDKRVWNSSSGLWEEDIVINGPGQTVQFNVSIHYPYVQRCYDLYIHFSGTILDVFPCNLRYENESLRIFPSTDYPPVEEVNWAENSVTWLKPPVIPPGESMYLVFNATTVCCPPDQYETNIITVSPSVIYNDSISVGNSQAICLSINADYYQPLNVTDEAMIKVICNEDQPAISVKKYSSNNAHGNWNDTLATKIPVWSFPKYKIDVRNIGEIIIDEVEVVDTLPDGFLFDGMVSAHPDPVISGQTLTWMLCDLTLDELERIIYKAAFPQDVECGEYENIAHVTGMAVGYDDVVDDDYAWVNVLCKEDGWSISLDVDQNYSDRGFRVMPGWNGAQEFKPSYNTLSKVDLYMSTWGEPWEPIVFQICWDTAKGNILFESTILKDGVPNFPTFGWVTITISDLPVIPGERYVIVLRDNDEGDTHNCLMWGWCDSYDGIGPYRSGEFLLRKLGYPIWLPIHDWDFTFRTFGYNT